MPGNMRLHTRPPGHEFPVDDTPPSTRPSSAASTSSTPNRSTSMDSLHTNSSTSEKPTGEEFIPTRIIRAAPKVNANAMQFVKTGPASLHKSAKEQMKKAEVVKSLRKTSLQEEEEWQSNSPSSNPPTLEESSDWQANLDKWKSSRRKRNEDVLERVIEVKKYEKEEEYTKGRRKSKTFSEMREDKDKRGRRYNLVVHDTDNDDLSELGLNSGKVDVLSSLSDATEDVEPKDLYNDNKDAKSDAGFCTGSDTGSDGVFAEDNISDTSSALGDKKDAHDSLLDSGLPLNSKEPTEPLIMNGHISLTNSMSLSSSHQNSEYTYDKAIEEYKQFAENSVKKRTPSVSSLCSNTSLSKDDDKTMYRSQDLSKKMDDKLSFFHREMDQDLKTRVKEPRVIRREKNLKVDINKRRSMFELRDIDSENHEHKQINRRSVVDVSNKLKTKVMSFENISESDKRTRAVTPQRDTKFKEKLANFSQKESHSSSTATPTRKKTPERDQNFYKKLQSFTRMESEEVTTKSIPRTLNSSPKKPISIGTRDNKFPTWRSPERKVSSEVGREKSSVRSGMPLKERIASFENLSPADEILRTREKSVSMECLNKPLFTDDFKPLNSSISVSNLYRRTPSTPFMVVEVDENVESEETCTKSRVSRSYLSSSTVERKEQTLRNSSENVIKNNVFTNNREDDIPPLGPPPKVPNFSTSSGNSKIINSQRRASPSPTRISPTVQKSSSPARRSPSPSVNRVPLSPTKSSPSPTTSRTSASPTRNSSIPSVNRGSISPTRRISLPKVPDSPPPAPPPQIPDSPPNGFSPLTPEIAPDIPKCAPPNFGFQGHSQSYSSSTIEIMSQELEEFEPQDSIDDMAHLQEYGDEDIDEVIDNYEHLSESVTGEELPQHHFYESALEMGSLPNDQLSKDLYTENMYERIQDDEPVYENIYEKVLDGGEVEVLDSLEGSLEHQYQTLEEVKTEVENLVSPPLPPKNNSSSSIEVLDVTWTDEYSTPIMPPSVPPPPPPPDEDDFEDGMDGEETVPLSLPLSASNLEQEERQSRSTTSTKQELRQKMSDFLGTQPQIQEELTLKPPPDVNEILRQERVEERMIVQKQQNLSREIPLMDFDPLLPQPYRPRYTWEDRMRDDSVRPQDLNESSDQMNFQLPKSKNDDEHAKNTYLRYVRSHSHPHPIQIDYYPHHMHIDNYPHMQMDSIHLSSIDKLPHMPIDNLANDSTTQNYKNINNNESFQPYSREISSAQDLSSVVKQAEEGDTLNLKSLTKPSESLIKPSECLIKPSECLIKPSESTIKPSESMTKSSECPTPSESLIKSSSSLVKPSESLKNFNKLDGSPSITTSVDATFTWPNMCNHSITSSFVVNDANFSSTVNLDASSCMKIHDERHEKSAPSRTISVHYKNCVSAGNSHESETRESYEKSDSFFSPKTDIDGKNQIVDSKISSSLSDFRAAPLARENLVDNDYILPNYLRKNVNNNQKHPHYVLPNGGENAHILTTHPRTFIHHSLPIRKNEVHYSNRDSTINCDVRSEQKPSVRQIIFNSTKELKPQPKILDLNSVTDQNAALDNQSKEIVQTLSASQCASVDILPDVKISKLSKNKSSNSNKIKQEGNGDNPSKHSARMITIIFPPNSNTASNSTYVIANTPINPSSSSSSKNKNILSDKFPNEISAFDIHSTPSPNMPLDHFSYNPNASLRSTNLHAKSYSNSQGVSDPRKLFAQQQHGVVFAHEANLDSSKCTKNFSYPHLKKLEELEQEMVKHDREMLQRVKSSNSLEEKSKEYNGQTCTDSKITHPNTNQTIQDDYRPLPMEHNNLSSVSAEENIYSVTSTANIPPPSQYSEFARGIPNNQQIYSEAYYEEETGSVSSRTSRQPNLASQADLPVNLPLQEFYKTPIIDEQLSNDSNHINYQENISYEEDSNSVQESLYRNEVGATTEAQPRKQSILALSAIPKPRLTDNDSWIMKKKADAGKKDYNKHWLFQEAEQRRLEQQDRISRMKPTLTESSSLNKLSNTLPTTSSYQSHFQNVKSNFNQTTNANYSYNVANGAQSPSNVYNSSNVSNVSPSPYSSPNSSSSNIIKPPRSIQPSSSSSNFSASYATSGQPLIPNGTMNGSNNNWMKQTKTYQPEIPLPATTSSKPLPDSIINTLTQRVNNKNKNIPSSRTPVYKTNYRDDNYHDYMNTEFNSSTSNTSPTIPQGVIPQGVIPQGGIPQSQSSPAPEDQRLLSVSGKKKCSHCGEELGRGAAMIIESLRLFYHIPCFKCCVCGIQLGNGTSGADVRVRNHKLHCHNCYSNDEGMKFSKV